ncbi:MAG: BamA/TamA family outer membrane protein [Bacteroidota bacterium]
MYTNIKLHLLSTITKWVLFWLILLTLGSCSASRYLDEGQKLYTGSELNIDNEEKIEDKTDLVTELNQVIRPEPNERILWWRYRLWFYNIAGEDPQGGLGKWLKNRIGREPVLWSDFDEEKTIRLLENRLFSFGYFDAAVNFEAHEKKHTASAEFHIDLPPPFRISEIMPLDETSEIAEQINKTMEKSLLEEDQAYKLSRLRDERERISKQVRDEGYFFFNPDFIIFRADTTIGNRKVKIALSLNQQMPDNASHRYEIRNIVLNANHILGNDTSPETSDSINLRENVWIINNDNLFKPATLNRTVFFESGDIYNTRDHDLTLNHLMGLEVFKFVNLRFSEVDASDTPQLDLQILLTPMKKKNLGIEISGVSKSTGFTGPGLSISFSNRNFLGGAEQFNINLDGSYEILIGAGNRNASSLEAGVTSELTIPRFVVPFGFDKINPLYLPRTKISLNFNYLSRTDAFSVTSFRSQFGYEWRQSVTARYRYYPLVFNIFALGTISEEYEEYFSRETLFRRGLFEQFLLGSEFSWTWNTQRRGTRKHGWFINHNIDLSGNIAYLLLDKTGIGTKSPEGDYEIFGTSFSQFSKTDFDIRHYLDMGYGQKLVSRIATGIGIPYGNSGTMPYIKLFTAGGSNGIRAFHPRSLGPGSYNSPDTLASGFDINQTGNIKLELNLEYRFAFTNTIKGAVFADAGNIWNLKEREQVPGGKFETSEFLNQIALGTGFGLRFDFTFFILRLDLAFPLAVPYDDSPTYFQPFKPFNMNWLSDNLLLNLAIGYPF